MTDNEAIIALVNILNRENIPYMLVGSYSSNQWGIPRSTKDADFVIQLTSENFTRLSHSIPSGLILNEQTSFEMVTSTKKDVIKVDKSDFIIELFHLSDDAFDQARFARRVAVNLSADLAVYFPTAEDVIIQKLRWAKDAARDKDFNDVVDVLKVQTTLDFEHIHHWCKIHDTTALLAEAQEAAQ